VCPAARGELGAWNDQAVNGFQNIQPTPPCAPIIAAHYFGRHWPKNFISAFRREHVYDDFTRLREDGFNTVILLVSWGDFQPVMDPCCEWDERAFARLHFLFGEAARADLRVILRVGYAWSFHPEAGTLADRMGRLLNRDSGRAAFLAFAERLGHEIAAYDRISLTFMSWEDQWLRVIDPQAGQTLDDYTSLLPAGVRPGPGARLPSSGGEDAPLFNAYWDWLVMYRLFEPARRVLPSLSYEVRVDKDPYYATGDDGVKNLVGWLDHRAMYRQPGNAPVTVYWAPFWGAENVGEQLSARRAGELFSALLRETLELSGDRQIFIDQFNVVDNTPGHEHNAVIATGEVGDFLRDAVCIMKRHGVVGYGYWTTRDYHESPLYNPSFSYGLEGWTLKRAAGTTPEKALLNMPSGDAELQFSSGDELLQTVTRDFGRLPAKDDRPDRVCVEASAEADSSILVYADVEAAPADLRFKAGTLSTQCSDLVASPADDRLTLRLVAQGDSSLRVRDVWLFDHTQFGGFYDANGKPGPLHRDLVRLNREFAESSLPIHCGQ
jgi:hypothetical protein